MSKQMFESSDHTHFDYWEDRAGLVKISGGNGQVFNVSCASLEEFARHIRCTCHGGSKPGWCPIHTQEEIDVTFAGSDEG